MNSSSASYASPTVATSTSRSGTRCPKLTLSSAGISRRRGALVLEVVGVRLLRRGRLLDRARERLRWDTEPVEIGLAVSNGRTASRIGPIDRHHRRRRGPLHWPRRGLRGGRTRLPRTSGRPPRDTDELIAAAEDNQVLLVSARYRLPRTTSPTAYAPSTPVVGSSKYARPSPVCVTTMPRSTGRDSCAQAHATFARMRNRTTSDVRRLLTAT